MAEDVLAPASGPPAKGPFPVPGTVGRYPFLLAVENQNLLADILVEPEGALGQPVHQPERGPPAR